MHSTRRLSVLAASLITVMLVPAVCGAVPPPDPAWARSGRPLPEPRFLQPRLDDRLPHYPVRPAVLLEGRLGVRATAILAELVSRWGDAFQERHPGVQISLLTPYTLFDGEMLSTLVAGQASAAFISGESSERSEAAFRAAKGYPLTKVAVCGGSYNHFGFMDAGAVIVNSSNPLKEISQEQIDAIFSASPGPGSAAITTWGQLGLTGEWTDAPIHAWRLSSGALEAFMRERLIDAGDQWRGDLRIGESVGEIQAEVQFDRFAIGTNKLAYMLPTTRALAIRSRNAGPTHGADYESVALEKYPLRRVIDLYLDLPPGRAGSAIAVEFARFILSREGQQIVVDQGVFLPLRADTVAESRAALAN